MKMTMKATNQPPAARIYELYVSKLMSPIEASSDRISLPENRTYQVIFLQDIHVIQRQANDT